LNKQTPPQARASKPKILKNTGDPYSVMHWAKQLKVSDLELVAAVAHVGPLVDDVRKHLNAQRDVRQV